MRRWLTILPRRTLAAVVAMMVSYALPGFAQAPHDTPRRTGQVIILSETVIGGRVPMIDQLQSIDQYCGSPPGDDGRGKWWQMWFYPQDDPGLPQICRYQRRVRFSLAVTAPAASDGQSMGRTRGGTAGMPLAPGTRLDPESVWPGRPRVEQPREPVPRLDPESVWPGRPLPAPQPVPRLDLGPVGR